MDKKEEKKSCGCPKDAMCLCLPAKIDTDIYDILPILASNLTTDSKMTKIKQIVEVLIAEAEARGAEVKQQFFSAQLAQARQKTLAEIDNLIENTLDEWDKLPDMNEREGVIWFVLTLREKINQMK